MFFVIGSRNSSNSKRLVEVADKAGCSYSELIHSESSVPLEKIKENFNVEIQEVEIVKENVTFKVPGKLN